MDSEKNRIIEVVNYNANWKFEYKKETKRLKFIFQPIASSIHHIGSTSIPGMLAKPTIDILIEVSKIDKVDTFNELMKEAEYQIEGEYGIKGRRYFWKYPGNHKYHIHVFEKNDKNIIRYLAFKAYLIQNKKRAKEYGGLKKYLADKYPHSIKKYMDGKNDLIKKIEKEALRWQSKN